jgi:hypothetical protein
MAFQHNGRKIVTSYDHPPIGWRMADWSAVYENFDGAEDSHDPVGRGSTEEAAILDLIDQTEDAATNTNGE